MMDDVDIKTYGIVYKTVNLINNKYYIGKTCKSINDINYLGSGKILKRALNKYGKENFKRITLCECSSEKELNEKEIEYISTYKSCNRNYGYNIAKGGTGGDTLSNHPDKKEICKKIARHGKKNGMYGKKHTEHAKKIISSKNKGRTPSEEMRAKMSIAVKNSEKHKKACSSQEFRERSSKTNKGRFFSKEHRERIGLASKNRSKESNEKISACRKGKTWEEIFGEEKTLKMRLKIAQRRNNEKEG